ncbi:MAG: transglycosylase domain-containing protein, partial [Catalinimonas sp.]
MSKKTTGNRAGRLVRAAGTYLLRSSRRRPIRLLWIGFMVLPVLGILFLAALESNALNLFGRMPSLRRLENPKVAVPSLLYTADGTLVGKYYAENRSPVTYEQLPPTLIRALIATEDARFESHAGIDLEALGSIAYYQLSGKNRGGSTITQQLAKNLYRTRFDDNQGRLSRVPGLDVLLTKVREWIVAVKLERAYTKHELLTMYLNTVAFGSNAYGIKTAAKTYFNTTPDSLRTEEVATLVGLLKANTSYNPLLHPERSRGRRNVVLGQMAKYGYLTAAAADSLRALPLRVRPNLTEPPSGPRSYYRQAVRAFLEEWCRAHDYDLYTDGLRVHLTIDARMQQIAEAAVHERMERLQRTFDRHWRGRNPWIDERKQEVPGFLERAARRSPAYEAFKRRYGADTAAIERAMRTPRRMQLFTYGGAADTTLSPMDSLRYVKSLLHAGLMAMDPATGHVRAWVGGIDYSFFQYDHVWQAQRQPGSTFKPFVYATALEQGYGPCDQMRDRPVTVRYVEAGEEKSWSPRNADWRFTGYDMSLRWAMARSVNSVTAQLTERVGWDSVAATARRMGVESELVEVPSIGLGSSEVTLHEMVGAYGAFCNGGVWQRPLLVTRIEDQYGNLIHRFTA